MDADTRYSPWLAGVVVPVLKAFIGATLRFFALSPRGIATSHPERVPREGGLLILANHRSDLDPILLQWACRRPIHFMAKAELFDMRVIGPLMRFFHAFPVKRGEPDRTALKRAIALARSGEVVCIFPEGQLTETGQLQPLLPGASLVVRQAGVPVICCRLAQTERIMPYGKTRPEFARGARLRADWSEARTFDASEKDAILTWAEDWLGGTSL